MAERFERLPPSAPELNPVEHVWTTTKWGRMANAPPANAHELSDNVVNELNDQALEQRTLPNHFHCAGLHLR